MRPVALAGAVGAELTQSDVPARLRVHLCKSTNATFPTWGTLLLGEGRSCVSVAEIRTILAGESGEENLEVPRSGEVPPGHWPQAPTAPCGPGSGCPEALMRKKQQSSGRLTLALLAPSRDASWTMEVEQILVAHRTASCSYKSELDGLYNIEDLPISIHYRFAGGQSAWASSTTSTSTCERQCSSR